MYSNQNWIHLSRNHEFLIQKIQTFFNIPPFFANLDTSIHFESENLLLYSLYLPERSIIRERVVAGLRNAKANGKKLGRPKKRDDDAIRALRGQGHTIRAIAKKVGLSVGAVQRALK